MYGDHIKITWSGHGYYFLENGQSDIPLGWCFTESDLHESVREAVKAGTEDTNWMGWRALKAPRRDAERE
jgi:hypothetical protein